MEIATTTTATMTTSTPPSNDPSIFDIESYISRYQTKSNITHRRLLFASHQCYINNNHKEAMKGFQLLELRLKQMGNTKLYREVFGDHDDNTSSMEIYGGGRNVDDTNNNMDVDDHVIHDDNVAVVISDPPVNKTSHNNDSNKNKTIIKAPPSKFDYDTHYIHQAESNSSTTLQTLEANLSTAQSRLSKDSIRNSFLAIGKFYHNRGMSSEALRYFQRAKEYCVGSMTTASNIGSNSSSSRNTMTFHHQTNDIVLSIIECALDASSSTNNKMIVNLCAEQMNYQQNDSKTTTANNSQGAPSNSDNDNHHYNSKLKCARGIVYLNEGRYNLAATTFLSIKHVSFVNQFNSILSAEDIALYGGLLGLITLDRNKIESMIEIEAWRERLELHPRLNEAIKCYMKAEYGQCLQLLQSMKHVMAMDLFLQSHADKLLMLMREKCIIQFFQPYSSLSLIKMKDLFGFDTVDDVEDLVASLIESKRIVGAKIDGVNKTLTRMSVHGLEQRRRKIMMRKVGLMGDRLIDEVEGMILRMSCLENEIVVVGDDDNTKNN